MNGWSRTALVATGAAAALTCGLACQATDDSTTHATRGGSAATHLSWRLDHTPLDRSGGQLTTSTHDHLARAKALHEQILAVNGPRTVANTFEPLNEMYMHIDAAAQENDLFEEVHPDEAVREAAADGVQAVSKFVTELSLDRDLYDALAAIDLTGVDAATRFAVEKELRDYRRAGVDKPENVRKRIAKLNDEIVALGQEFQRNISRDVREIELGSVEQLAGMPQDFIDKHEPNDAGTIVIDTTYPDVYPFLTYAENGQARRRLYHEFLNRAYPDNLDVLTRLIRKRHEKAQLLGYSNWAEYVTEDKMIGSAERAADFIDRIRRMSAAAAKRDYDILLARKRKDVPGARAVEDYEKRYYEELVKKERYDFDAQELRPYFNFATVHAGLMDLTSRLFGVRYEQVEGLDLWHDEVTAWDIFDGDRQLGRFYLDLFPREDKYQHAACFGYREGIEGKRLPQAVLVCNFPNPNESADGLALMEFNEVETYFHEFGHLLHSMFAGHQRWMTNAGISTEWDFVEAPSQMLEEWLFDADTVQSFAKHHATGEPVPMAMLEKLRKANEFGKGMATAHQMFYAALSLNCYNRDPAKLDLMELVQDLQPKYSPFGYVEGTHFPANFGHLNGYSAIYYTYMWSQVIAKDMFTRFASEGVLNANTAEAYRRRVLDAGGSKPAAALVKDFLGRDYAFDAFKAWLDRT